MDFLDTPCLRFVATGRTYPHREAFKSWAWHWDAARRAWINENETSPDSPCIRALADLPGVHVRCEGPVE
jgi:hypothetical protein